MGPQQPAVSAGGLHLSPACWGLSSVHPVGDVSLHHVPPQVWLPCQLWEVHPHCAAQEASLLHAPLLPDTQHELPYTCHLLTCRHTAQAAGTRHSNCNHAQCLAL